MLRSWSAHSCQGMPCDVVEGSSLNRVFTTDAAITTVSGSPLIHLSGQSSDTSHAFRQATLSLKCNSSLKRDVLILGDFALDREYFISIV